MQTFRNARFLTVAAVAVVALLSGLVPATAGVTPGQPRANPNAALPEDAFVRGNDGVGVAIDPQDPNHIVMVNGDWITFQCEYHTTFDGGQTWTGGVFRAPTDFPQNPCSPIGHGSSAIDGKASLAQGRSALYFAFAAARSGQGQSVLVARSIDGGQTFSRAVEVLTGGPSVLEGPDYRYPKIIAEPRQGGPDKLFIVAFATNAAPTRLEKVVVAVSDDGGRTWSGPRDASPGGQQSVEASEPVLLDGSLYVAWRQRGFSASIQVGKSSDDGQTWSVVNAQPVVGFTDPVSGFQFTASSFPRLAGDPSNGNLYLVYGQGPIGGGYPGQTRDHFIHPDMDILFTKSSDGGMTWSEPVVVNEAEVEQGVLVTQTRHARISVAPNGRLDVAWHDRRHWFQDSYDPCTNTHGPAAGTAPCNEARLGDTYYAFSLDGGQSWSENRRITDRSINNDVGFDYRFGAYWDFGPVAEPIGTDEVLIAWMDSRLGNWNNDNLDLFHTRLDLDGEGRPPTQRLRQGNAVDLSVLLSRQTYPGGSEATLAATFATQPWTRVVIVNQSDAAGVLAGGVLGRANLGPVLLSPPEGLPPNVQAEVDRLDPIGAYVIGDETQLGAGVVADLEAAGVPPSEIERISGTQAEVAKMIAAEMDYRTSDQVSNNVPAFDAAVIVNPGTAHGTAAAVLAANRRLPILFVNQSSIPQATTDALDQLDIQQTLVIGGPSVVDGSVMSQLPSPTRVGANDVLATSQAAAQASLGRGLPKNIVYVTDPARPMDGALLGASVGRSGGLHLLARRASSRGALRSLQRLGVSWHVDRVVVVAGG